MENEFADIVERMVLIRQLLGMAQKELAYKIGYSLSTVKKVERGDRALTTDYFKAFFQYMGVSADFLLSE